jgi:MFS family permease
MALKNLAVYGGSFFIPVLVGKITHTIGWQWTFYFVAILSSACLPLVFLRKLHTVALHLNRRQHTKEELSADTFTCRWQKIR